ncbi:MAG: hypothetical protein CFE21_09625 [Bacteroidetes bacterium B1(2017)]|nr:MAG: hypothetical protein CFE21_09625 [Bacteroidetes bacterium B1(2017)]
MRLSIILLFLLAFITHSYAQICFSPAQEIYPQAYGNMVAKTDFNSDGRLDLALGVSNKIYFLTGQGNGQFDTLSQTLLSGIPNKLAFGDFNHDSKPDLAYGFKSGAIEGVAIAWGSSSNRYDSLTEVFHSSINCAFCIIDVNKDSSADVAITNYSSTVWIFYGSTQGAFKTFDTYNKATPGYSVAIESGDLNKDGWDDLVIGNGALKGSTFEGKDSITALINKKDGHFLPSVSSWCKGKISEMYIGDFNGDHNPDVLAANYNSKSTTVLWGSGGPAFFVAEPIGQLTQYYNYANIADFNLDGIDDIAFKRGDTSTIQVIVMGGTKDGKFADAQTYPVSGGAFFSGTINSDSLPDLGLTTGSKMQVLYNCSATGLETQTVNAFKFFPNPSAGRIFIQTNARIKDPSFEVYSCNGLLLGKPQIERNSPGDFTLNLNYSPGLYFVHVYDAENLVFIQKLVIGY